MSGTSYSKKKSSVEKYLYLKYIHEEISHRWHYFCMGIFLKRISKKLNSMILSINKEYSFSNSA